MQIIEKKVKIPLIVLFLLGLLILAVVTIYSSFQVNNPEIKALISGIGGGFVVSAVVLLLSIYEYIQIDKFRALGITDVLTDRRKQNYYRDFVIGAKSSVQVMGSSCTAFVDDFANLSSSDHVLVDALNRNQNLLVQFLIPTDTEMDTVSRGKLVTHKHKIDALIEQYGTRVEIKRYNSQPRHSLVKVDDEVIVGPIFPDVESRNSPAIRVNITSPFAAKYIEYFERAWATALPFS